MTDRELMQQALDALEGVVPYTDSLICYASTVEEHPPNAIDGKVSAAIDALRDRLAQREPICDGCGGTIAQHTAMLNCRCDSTRFCDDWPRCNPPCHIGKRSGAVPARQEQEPVASCWQTSRGEFHNFSPAHHAAASAAACRRMGQTFHRLYTAPQPEPVYLHYQYSAGLAGLYEAWQALPPCNLLALIGNTIQDLQAEQPQRREWVGLTDGEIDILWNQHESRFDFYSFSCDIEAALKEKNK